MLQLQGVNYHESTEIRCSVKIKIDLAYFRLRLHRPLAAQKPAESCTGSNVLGWNLALAVNASSRNIIPTFERSESRELQNVGKL